MTPLMLVIVHVAVGVVKGGRREALCSLLNKSAGWKAFALCTRYGGVAYA